MAGVLVLHGPNLNLLGTREPDIYGSVTLDEINQSLTEIGARAGITVSTRQSNAEHELIDSVHTAKKDGVQFIVINPGAFTHTSIALRDALAGVSIPFIECHLSNVHAREHFRKHSYLSDLAVGVICGFGEHSYQLAMDAALRYLQGADA